MTVPKTTRAKRNMVTQAIKRWLQNLFAWWPWKRYPETDYAHPQNMMNMGATQESILRTTVDGSITQPGTTSVAVEHAEGTDPTETNWATTEEHLERVMPSLPEDMNAAFSSSVEPGKKPPQSEGAIEDAPPPTIEQQLEFLRYLVRRGVVNEGFERGNEPDQYKKPV